MPIYGEAQDPWGETGRMLYESMAAVGKQLELNRERQKREVEEAVKEATTKRAEFEQMDPSERYAAEQAYRKRWEKAPPHVQQAVTPILDAEYMKGTPTAAAQKAANVESTKASTEATVEATRRSKAKPTTPEEEVAQGAQYVAALKAKGIALSPEEEKYVTIEGKLPPATSLEDVDLRHNRFRDQVMQEATTGGKPDDMMYTLGEALGYGHAAVDTLYANAIKRKEQEQAAAHPVQPTEEIDKDFAKAGLGKTGGYGRFIGILDRERAKILQAQGYKAYMSGGKDQYGNDAIVTENVPSGDYEKATKQVIESQAPAIIEALRKHNPALLKGTRFETADKGAGKAGEKAATGGAATIDDILAEREARKKKGK